MTITQEQLNGWYEHKSNKEAWIEAEEARQDEIQEDTTSLEEKLEELDNHYKDQVENPQKDLVRETIEPIRN